MKKYFVSYMFKQQGVLAISGSKDGFGNAVVPIKGKFNKKEVERILLKDKINEDVKELIILFFKKIE